MITTITSKQGDKLQLPVVHLNGTSKRELKNLWLAPYSLIGDAYDQLKRAAPHMRDYYVLPGGGQAEFLTAQEQHYSRLRRLEQVREELETLCNGIDKQEGR